MGLNKNIISEKAKLARLIKKAYYHLLCIITPLFALVESQASSRLRYNTWIL